MQSEKRSWSTGTPSLSTCGMNHWGISPFPPPFSRAPPKPLSFIHVTHVGGGGATSSFYASLIMQAIFPAHWGALAHCCGQSERGGGQGLCGLSGAPTCSPDLWFTHLHHISTRSWGHTRLRWLSPAVGPRTAHGPHHWELRQGVLSSTPLTRVQINNLLKRCAGRRAVVPLWSCQIEVQRTLPRSEVASTSSFNCPARTMWQSLTSIACLATLLAFLPSTGPWWALSRSPVAVKR